MKKTLIISLLLLLFFVAAYVVAGSLVNVRENSFAILEDTENGSISVFPSGYNLIWQGVIPGRINIYYYNRKCYTVFNIEASVPGMESLHEFNKIRCSVEINYEIDKENLSIPYSLLEKGSDLFNYVIMGHLKSLLIHEMRPYFSSVYKRSDLIRDRSKIVDRIIDSLRIRCNNTGIRILNYKIAEKIEVPNRNDYYSELSYLNQLKLLKKESQKEMIILKGKLEKEKNVYQSYYKKLNSISGILKNNPDILKYIFIDKLSENVKVIITSDRLSIPPEMILDDKGKNNAVGDEIDNLR